MPVSSLSDKKSLTDKDCETLIDSNSATLALWLDNKLSESETYKLWLIDSSTEETERDSDTEKESLIEYELDIELRKE